MTKTTNINLLPCLFETNDDKLEKNISTKFLSIYIWFLKHKIINFVVRSGAVNGAIKRNNKIYVLCYFL